MYPLSGQEAKLPKPALSNALLKQEKHENPTFSIPKPHFAIQRIPRVGDLRTSKEGLENLVVLGVDSDSILSTIALSNHQRFPWASDGFLERRIPGKNGWKVPLDVCASMFLVLFGHVSPIGMASNGHVGPQKQNGWFRQAHGNQQTKKLHPRRRKTQLHQKEKVTTPSTKKESARGAAVLPLRGGLHQELRAQAPLRRAQAAQALRAVARAAAEEDPHRPPETEKTSRGTRSR